MQRRRAGRAISAALCLPLALGSLLGTGVLPSAADDSTRTRDQVIAALRTELAESSEAMLLAATDLRLADAALPGARHTAEATHRLLVAAQRRQQAAAERRGRAQVQLILASQSAEVLADEVDQQQSRIGRIARAAYQGGGSMASLSMLLDSSSPTDFAERMATWETVVSSQRSALDDLQTLQASYSTRTDALERVRDDLAEADKTAQAELAAIAELEAQARAAEAEVTRLVSARQDALAAARAAQAVDTQQGQVQQGESSSLQRDLAAQAHRLLGAAGDRRGSSVAPQPGTLSWPVNGPVTSPFGIRVHPITGVKKLHTGTDLGVACGTPIHVARGGTVVSAGYNTAYGYRTVVSHGVVGGVLLTTTYNHQSHLGVSAGQQVVAGQVIGLSGTTGYSTGCHLHFELLVNADFVDPMPWMVPR